MRGSDVRKVGAELTLEFVLRAAALQQREVAHDVLDVNHAVLDVEALTSLQVLVVVGDGLEQ